MSKCSYYRKLETAIDIALIAGAFISEGTIECDDSRELIASIIQWSDEFEYSGYNEEDYMSEIEKFAENKLKSKYGNL